MTNEARVDQKSANRGLGGLTFYKRSVVMPTEHGAWSWLLVPFLVGAIVSGGFGLAGVLSLVVGLSGFLVRQPATVWMSLRRGKGRAADGQLAWGWMMLFTVLFATSLGGLLIMGRVDLFLLLGPMAAIMIIYILAARQKRSSVRNLWMEVAGAIGLAAMAPFAYIAIVGEIEDTVWILWALMAIQNVVGVLYVRLRVADTHQRSGDRRPMLYGHLVGLAAVAATVALLSVPALVIVPFVLLAVRAMWTFIRPRPIPVIKKFGFTEIGVELLSGLWIALSFVCG